MAKEKDYLHLENAVLQVLKSIYDPEIPVNIYDLGLIYRVDIDDDNNVDIDMTLTSPNCPVADSLVMEVRDKVSFINGVKATNINLIFDPPWDKEMMSEEAKLELGFL